MDKEWNLFFLGFRLIECHPHDPDCLFIDAEGQAWRENRRQCLVAPDPEERGLPITMRFLQPGQKE